MTKPGRSRKTSASIWAVALLFVSSGFALVSAALLSAEIAAGW